MAGLGFRPMSSTEAKARVRKAVEDYPDAEVGEIAVRAHLGLRRTALILEGLQRMGSVELYTPRAGITRVRGIRFAEALKRKRS